MTRWLRIVGIGFGALVLVLVLLAGFVLGTTPGARFVLDRTLPAGARVGEVDGRLWGPLVLHDLRFAGPGMDARVARVRVDWSPTRLLRRTIAIAALEVDTAEVRLLAAAQPTVEEEEDSEGLTRPSVPLAVRVDAVQGRAVTVVTANGDTLRVDGITAAGGARQDTFDLDSLRLRDFDYRGSRYQIDAAGSIITGSTGARDSADLELEWSGRLRDGRRLAGRGAVRGAAGALVVEHRLTAPVAASLDARVQVPWAPDTLTWSLTLDVPRVALANVRDGLPGAVELTATAEGSLMSAEASLTARGEHPAAGPVAAETRVRYGDGTVRVDTLRLWRLSGQGALDAAGRIVGTDAGPEAEIRLAWRELGWPLDTAAIVSPDGSLRVAGGVADFQVQGGLTLRQPDRALGRWAVEAEGGYADGRLSLPRLAARNRAGGRLALSADVTLAGAPRGDATLEWSDLAWPPAAGDSTRLASRAGRVAVQGGPDDFTVRSDVSFSGPAVPLTRVRLDVRGDVTDDAVNARVRAAGTAEGAPALELSARGSWGLADRTLTLDTVDARLPETGGRLGLRGRADLSGPDPALSGRARWRDLGWPVQAPRFRSDRGELTVSTRGGRVRLLADARIGGLSIPEGQWRLAGQGELDRFVVDSLRGRLLAGEVRAAGVVRSDAGPAWELEVTGDTLDPGEWWEGWDGRVGFRLRTDGRLTEAGPSFQATLDRLEGRVRERAVAAGARVRGAEGRLAIDTLWLRSGGSEVEAMGTVGDSLDVAWRLAAESLSDFVPEAAGELDARGSIVGPRTSPSLTVAAEGRGVTLAGWTAGRVTAAAGVEAGGRRPSTAALRAVGVQSASVVLDSVALEAEGTLEDHEAAVRVHAPGDALEGRVSGALRGDLWVGGLERFRLRSRRAGEWRLRDTARLRISADSGAVDGLCWVGPGELCVAADWDPTGVRWEGSGQALPMAFLGPVLPEGLAARGEFRLETRGRATGGAVPTGTFRVTGGAGEIQYAPDIGRTVTQTYEGFDVEAESDSTGLDAGAELRLGGPGELRGTLSLSGADPLADRPLSGRLTLRVHDDGTVSRFVPALSASQGRARADVTLAGTVRTPEVRGSVSVTEAGAVVAPAGIRLSDGSLTATSTDGGRWRLEGGVRSDTSRLRITGSARPPRPDSAWHLDLALEADRFPMVQTPELTIIASPRLDVRASADSVIVDGRVAVPRALVAVRDLEGTASTSPDVVIVGAGVEGSPDSAMTPAAVRAEVELVLGDSVRIDALGLTGRLEGQLTIVALPGRPPVGTGELRVIDGRYRIYRQTFQIDRGQLLYASTPLTDPGLDLRITRGTDEVTAGMNITGRASDPRVELFSDPALGDEEILAYLIAGRPLRQLTQSEGDRVTTMAASLGVTGGNLLLARLSSVFGLETARIERTRPGNGPRGARLLLGRQVLPRVHLDYAIGLHNAANVIRLRYMITDHWIFQTESGEETGADLLYTFER